jgi:hypothetical protein
MAVLVGTKTGGATADSFASNELDMWPFNAAADGWAWFLGCNPGTASAAGITSLDLAIYDGAGADPVNLLGTGRFGGRTPSTEFKVRLAAPVLIVNGTKYWLAINPHGGTFSVLEAATGSYYVNTGANASPPNTAPVRSVTGTGGLAIWAEDLPAVGPHRMPLGV